jgi:hypothetical protein
MTARCRACKEPIVWLKTKEGKNMPVNDTAAARRYAESETLFEVGVEEIVPHWSTCTEPGLFRRKEKT